MRLPNIQSLRRVPLDVRVERKRLRWPIFLLFDGLALLFPLPNLTLPVLFGIEANVGGRCINQLFCVTFLDKPVGPTDAMNRFIGTSCLTLNRTRLPSFSKSARPAKKISVAVRGQIDLPV